MKEGIVESFLDNTIYQDLYDFRGSQKVLIDDLKDPNKMYELIIKFKFKLQIESIAKELFPKIFDKSKFDAFFDEVIFKNEMILNVYNKILSKVKREDKLRLVVKSKLNEEKRIAFENQIKGKSLFEIYEFILSKNN